MAVRKSKDEPWAMNVNDGRFSSPKTIVWEIAAGGGLARLSGRKFAAAYIDCSNVASLLITMWLPKRQ